LSRKTIGEELWNETFFVVRSIVDRDW